MAQSLIRLPEVIRRVGYQRSAIYQKVREGGFPPPVKLGRRSVAWSSDEIDRWIQERISASRQIAASGADHGT